MQVERDHLAMASSSSRSRCTCVSPWLRLILLLHHLLALMMMMSTTTTFFSISVLLPYSIATTGTAAASVDSPGHRHVFVAYLGEKLREEHAAESLHLNILEKILEDSNITARESLLYSYKRSFNGFVARLNVKEKEKLAGMEETVSVFESGDWNPPQTTRSWDFLGLPQNAVQNPTVDGDTIVGVIDTGIWPESESFIDEHRGPPPQRWKGVCQNFTCNRKIIGARYYNIQNSYTSPDEERSPRDFEGHGTHTASIIAGNEVKNISFYGLAGGTVRGGLPSASIAVYKVSWLKGNCYDHDILAAFDDAIADGVDIISYSLGGVSMEGYFNSAINIGSFHAMKKGILTVSSAGNADVGAAISNFAPWLLIVAASSIDRRILTKMTMIGNSYNKTIVGNSINIFPTPENFSPLVYSGAVSNKSIPNYYADDCNNIDKNLVKGKIVLCDTPCSSGYVDGSGAYLAGAQGLVIIEDPPGFSLPFPLPAMVVGNDEEGVEISNFLNKTRGNGKVKLHKSEAALSPEAPRVASFSVRGPNQFAPDILKPDISAPGVEILAAWSPKAPITDYQGYPLSVKYAIMSGTSVACAHVTAAAAIVKIYHPTWSPAAIMSALMTTASPMNASDSNAAELAYGAGQINITKAQNPGLVYDATEDDYIQLLCNQGYAEMAIKLITGRNNISSCTKTSNGDRNLNYPSMSYFPPINDVKQLKPYNATFTRMVTNVGLADSTYRATVISDGNFKVTVEPSILSFKSLGEKKRFVVAISGPGQSEDWVASASLVWSDGTHSVRSPIATYVWSHEVAPC